VIRRIVHHRYRSYESLDAACHRCICSDRFDPRDTVKQGIATKVLHDGLIAGDLVLPHQAIVEFIAAVKRPRTEFGGRPLVPLERATLEAESYMAQFPIVYPTPEVLRAALHGLSAYRLSWFDAHLWAHAEVHGIPEILSEDFEHGRHYGRVRVADPFLMAADRVNELPALYAT
jgi:predicted nucleic acid-binding protein